MRFAILLNYPLIKPTELSDSFLIFFMSFKHQEHYLKLNFLLL